MFDTLKSSQNCSSSGLSQFLQEYILETDASLNGLDTILSQQGKDREIHIIGYASHSLHPSERPMCNYSSAKLELLVMEKFSDYLSDSQFQVYMDNNPLTYVLESKLGASQIWWLCELALFNFVNQALNRL